MLVGQMAFGLWMVVLVLVLPIVFVGLALWILVSAKRSVHMPVMSPLPDSPIARARRRFTLGEISYEEYARMMRTLTD